MTCPLDPQASLRGDKTLDLYAGQCWYTELAGAGWNPMESDHPHRMLGVLTVCKAFWRMNYTHLLPHHWINLKSRVCVCVCYGFEVSKHLPNVPRWQKQDSHAEQLCNFTCEAFFLSVSLGPKQEKMQKKKTNPSYTTFSKVGNVSASFSNESFNDSSF